MAVSKKYQKIIDKWIKNDGDETELTKKYHISYKKWANLLRDKYTINAIEGRVELAKRKSQLLKAKYLPLATAKLIELCNSENNETSRKACVDLIKEEIKEKCTDSKTETGAEESGKEVNPETASTILAVLAEKKKRI